MTAAVVVREKLKRRSSSRRPTVHLAGTTPGLMGQLHAEIRLPKEVPPERRGRVFGFRQ